MTRFYLESADSDMNVTSMQSANRRADERVERWDSDPNFMRLDTWSEAELADDARFGHYMSRLHLGERK